MHVLVSVYQDGLLLGESEGGGGHHHLKPGEELPHDKRSPLN